MYTRFYHLSKKPFEISADPRFLWLGEKHKEGLAILRYALMDEKGFLLLTGDVGTGKTTLINALLQDIGDNVRVANVTIPNLDPIGFFNHIARAFLIPQQFDRKEDFLHSFKAFLEQTRLHKNQRVVLIIDEAHTLSKEMLEEVRLLSNIELPEKKLINIFLVGQNEINPLLMSPECRSLRQRITINYNIKNLSVAETQQYIAHRLKVAGTEARLFTQEAIDRIQRFSRGYPRLINIICDLALVTGYARNLKKITPAVILECARETLLPGEEKEDLFLDESHFTMGTDLTGHPLIGQEQDAATAAGSAVNVLENSRKPAESRPEIRPTRSREPVRQPVVPVKRRWMLALLVIFAVFIGAAFFWMPPEDWSSWLASKAATAPEARNPVLPEMERVTTAPMIKIADQTNFDSFDAAAEERNPMDDPVPASAAASRLQQARNAMKEKDYPRVIQLMESAGAADAGDPADNTALYVRALREQAKTLLKSDMHQAEALLHQAVEIDAQQAMTFYELGNLYAKKNDYAKAVEAYARAADLDAGFADIFYNLGFSYAAIKDDENAEKSFLRALELKPPYLDKVLFNLAMVQYRQDKIRECIGNLEAARKVNPDNHRARRYLKRLAGVSGGP